MFGRCSRERSDEHGEVFADPFFTGARAARSRTRHPFPTTSLTLAVVISRSVPREVVE